MVARTLLILFLVLFFARPIFHSGGFLTGNASNESMVILLDVSASLSAGEGGHEGLEWTKDRLKAALQKIPLGVKIGLIVYSDQVEQELAPTDERSRVTTAIQNAKVTFRGTNVAPAIQLAGSMLSHQAKGRKTLVVASDGARHGWRSLLQKEAKITDLEAEVRLVLWDAVGLIPNRGFSSAHLELSEDGWLKGQAVIHSSEDSGHSPAWTLRLNNRVVAQGLWKEGPLALQAQLPEGGFYSGRLDLSPDAAAFDDAYYLAGRVPKGFRLLLVDGESGLAPSDAETYYLRSALESPHDPRLESISVIRPEALARESFEKYDAIVLANVPDVGEGSPKEAELLAWLEKGGGLLITAGSKWPKPPRVPLRLFRARAWSTNTEKSNGPVGQVPFLSNVSGLKDFQWDQISVSEHIPLEMDSAIEPILSLKNGDVLLARKQIGKGFVVCLTTTLDRAWTNFPAKPVFAPLMRELVASLADPQREQTSLQAWVGEPVRLQVSPGVKSVSVLSPDGVASGAHVNSQGVMEWPAPTLPGIYQVKTDRRTTDFSFAVNIPDQAHEGDFSRLTEKEARGIFPDNPVEVVNSGARKMEALVAALQGHDMANSILVFLFLLFLAETILGWVGRKS